MKTAFKVLILFLIVFSFRMPYFYNTALFSAVLTLGYYWISRGSIPVAQFNNRYIITILTATLVLSWIVLFISVAHDNYASIEMQKRVFLQLFMLFATVIALPLFLEGHEDHAFEEMAKIVGITFAVQGAIHLTGFLYNPFGEMIARIAGNYETYLHASGAANIKPYRCFALCGSIFFELPGAYGAASIILFRLLMINGQKYISGYWTIIVLFLIFAGICLSGRTGFIGFFMGVGMYLIFVPKTFPDWHKTFLRWAISATVVGIIYGGVLSPTQRKSFTDDLFPFAFEAYYNWRNKGAFTTGSTEVTMKAHYYPLRSETLLHGHGTAAQNAGYEYTDAGYMGALIFGGVFYLLLLAIYQCLYFVQPIAIANSRGTKEGKQDLFCFFLLTIYLFILEYKGTALGTQHYTEVLFVCACLSYLVRYNYRVENGIERP